MGRKKRNPERKAPKNVIMHDPKPIVCVSNLSTFPKDNKIYFCNIFVIWGLVFELIIQNHTSYSPLNNPKP